MKKPKCYNCKHACEQFKIDKLTHLHCGHMDVHKEDPNPWHSLRVFSDTCKLHEFKPSKCVEFWTDRAISGY